MKRGGKIWVMLGALLCLAFLIFIFHHFQLRFALSRYIAELKTKGEPMDWAQVIPPPVPPEQNGVPFIFDSITNLNHRSFLTTNAPSAMCMVATGRAMITSQQPDIRSAEATNTWEELGRELVGSKNKLLCLQILTNYSELDFKLDYEKGLALQLPHLYWLRQAADLLNSSVLYDSHQDNVTEACTSVRAMLALVEALGQEPLQAAQRLRLGIVRQSASITWEILQNTNVNDADLAGLENGWEPLGFIKPMEQADLMERVSLARSLDYYREHADELWQYVMTRGGLDKFWYENQWRWFWSYADEIQALRIDQVVLDATRIVETNCSYQMTKSFTAAEFLKLGLKQPGVEDSFFHMDYEGDDFRWLFSEGAENSFHFLRWAISTEVERNVVRAAIAIKRYEIQHHRLPETLDKLTPEFLKTVPIDWMDGRSLRYRPNLDGSFLLYSVGENGRDDGGNPASEKDDERNGAWVYNWRYVHALDWVWPQPATAAEIQQYYTKLANYPNRAGKLNSIPVLK